MMKALLTTIPTTLSDFHLFGPRKVLQGGQEFKIDDAFRRALNLFRNEDNISTLMASVTYKND
jgi:hypothetical protein